MAQVLVVDDDDDIRQSMRAVLEDMGGYTVLEASDGELGLAQIRASKTPLVVLLDFLMPKLNGVEVLQEVAADKRLAKHHAFVMVSVSRQISEDDFLKRWAFPVAVVPKPFDIAELLTAVTEAEHNLPSLCNS